MRKKRKETAFADFFLSSPISPKMHPRIVVGVEYVHEAFFKI